MTAPVCLGIDTSNYRTSCAAAQSGTVLANEGQLLKVRLGERGLRQSEAVFQHVQALPDVIQATLRRVPNARGRIACVAVSDRPRPAAGSYMPVFRAGLSTARSLSEALGIPLYRFSHQEGHIEAAAYGTPIAQAARFCAFHFSGGTTEALLCSRKLDMPGLAVQKIGGTLDISFGQLLDRVGVRLGMPFPCGSLLDEAAGGKVSDKRLLPAIRVKNGSFNLSGIENSADRLAEETDLETLSRALFRCLADVIRGMTAWVREQYDVSLFLFAGGVASSRTLRSQDLTGPAGKSYFGDPRLSGDNAAGIALAGGRSYAFETDHGVSG